MTLRTIKKAFLIFFAMTTFAVAGGLSLDLPFSGGYRLSSPFGGPRTCTPCSKYHPAVDYATPVGTPIISTISGTVTRAVHAETGYGNFITVVSNPVDGCSNYSTQYSHMSSLSLSSGTPVSAGTVVGMSGNSGSGTGAHLDYKVGVQDPDRPCDNNSHVPVDPLLAQGKNLDDPNVRRQLIADSKARLNGEKTMYIQGGDDGVYSEEINPLTFEEGTPLGCDSAVLEQGRDIVDAMNERDAEAAKAIIDQPTPVEQTTCLDQSLQLMSAAGGIHSEPGGDISDSTAPLAEDPLAQFLEDNFGSPVAGSLQSIINEEFAAIVSDFSSMFSGGGLLGGGLGGLLGGDASTNCDMMEQSWLFSQCIQLPEIPSLSELLLGGLFGGMENPIEQMCQSVSDKLGDYVNDVTGKIESASESMSTPISDSMSR